jgi:hypothetical protein
LCLLTPAGIRAKLQLTRNFLARKEQAYIAMKAEIEALRKELADHENPPPENPQDRDQTSRKTENEASNT